MTLADIARATGGNLSDEGRASQCASGLTWDSREVQPGWLYAALPGERVDGHDFVAAAAAAGAVAALVAHSMEAPLPLIVVDDVQGALGRLAVAWRSRLSATVVGLTGSTGKTTTKALMRDVLAAAGTVVATKANQNNELGVPRTLFNADKDTDFIVVEMGMRGRGQIAELCDIALPDWGLVTNVGESHMELLGTRENIARAKAELFQALPSGGVAFVNAGDDYAPALCRMGQLQTRGVASVFYDGTGEGRLAEVATADAPQVWVEDVVLNGRGYPTFTLCASGFARQGNPGADGARPCSLRLKGAHNVINACAAAAVGLAAGLGIDACCAALEASQPEAGRQQLHRAACGALVVNDAYNANPDSMRASLLTFAAFDVKGARIAVLGDMGELGPIAEEAHHRVGTVAARAKLDMLVCVGDLSRHIAQGARSAGMDEAAVVVSDTLEDALALVQGRLGADDAVLVKASHFMGFEKIVEGLVE